MTKLKMLRFELDMQSKDLAEGLKVHPTSLSKVETRKIKASDLMRYRLSKFYGLPESELFDDGRYAV